MNPIDFSRNKVFVVLFFPVPSQLLFSFSLPPFLPHLLFASYKGEAEAEMSDRALWFAQKSNKKENSDTSDLSTAPDSASAPKECKLINLCGLGQFIPAGNLALSL